MSALVASSFAQAHCDNQVTVKNATTDHFMKVREGYMNETEVVLHPGEEIKRCFSWGIHQLTIKSINPQTMRFTQSSTCPNGLTLDGTVDVVINNTSHGDGYECTNTIVERVYEERDHTRKN